jgi:hypothetical protein
MWLMLFSDLDYRLRVRGVKASKVCVRCGDCSGTFNVKK